jgi:maltose O-acetyltransferase
MFGILRKSKRALSGILRQTIVQYYRIFGVKIGKNTFISYSAKIDTTYPNSVIIEDNVFITHGAIIMAHDHSVYRHKTFSEDNGRGCVILKKNVFVGAMAIILRNVTIGENSIVGAGAVVTQNVPPNTVVAGNPARIMKTFSMTMNKQELL